MHTKSVRPAWVFAFPAALLLAILPVEGQAQAPAAAPAKKTLEAPQAAPGNHPDQLPAAVPAFPAAGPKDAPAPGAPPAAPTGDPKLQGTGASGKPASEGPTDPEAGSGEPGGPDGASGGLLQKMARNLFGKKPEEAASGAAEEESGGPESHESQRKAKELGRLAIQNIEKKRISEAKKNINDLITLKPYEADYHLALGLCFRQEQRYKDALKKYQDVLDLGGPKSLVNLLRAEAMAAEGERDKVFEFLKESAMGGRNIVADVQNLPLLEKYKGETDFIKLALNLEKFDVTSKKNQDPFTNPFPSSAREGIARPQNVQAGPITLNPQDQQNLLSEARRVFEKVQWYIKLEDEDKAMENYIKLRDIIEKKDLLTLPKIVNDFRILVSRMDTLETQIEGIRLKYYWNQAQARLKELKDSFQATEYAKVDTIYAEVDKLAKEMEKSNPRFKPVAERILAAAKVWLNRSHIRKEFQASKPDIQGVVIAEEAKMAVIDNRVIRQGERFGEYYVQKVENNRVTFRYKGEEIPLIFRRY